MKLTTTLLAALFAVLSFSAGATDPESTVVRVLPTDKAGYIKVLYINPEAKKVDVKFYGKKGLIESHQFKAKQFDKGFIQTFDLSNLETGEYTIKVSDGETNVSYKIDFNEESNEVWAKHWQNESFRDISVSK